MLKMHSGQSSDCNDCSYELMSVYDLQLLGVHVGRCPPGDCGKETKRESDAALEWIAQQCETTQPQMYQGGCMQVAEPRGGCTR